MKSVIKQLNMNSAAAEFAVWGSALLCSDAELLLCGAGRAPSGPTVTFTDLWRNQSLLVWYLLLDTPVIWAMILLRSVSTSLWLPGLGGEESPCKFVE